MSNDEDGGIGYWLTHPGTAVAALGATAGGLFDLVDPVLALVSSTVQTWYPLVSALWRAGDLIPALPGDLLEQVFMLALACYIGVLAVRFGESLLSKT